MITGCDYTKQGSGDTPPLIYYAADLACGEKKCDVVSVSAPGNFEVVFF